MNRNSMSGKALAISLCVVGVVATTFWFGSLGSRTEITPSRSAEPSKSQPSPIGRTTLKPVQPSDTKTDNQPGHGNGDRPMGEPDLCQKTPAGASEADGALPDKTTVFDDQYPGIANLDPDFLQALRDAATAAKKNKVVFYVASGWRSPAYQEQLFQEAIATYGSVAEASEWVAPPGKSLHVSGDAIDIDNSTAQAWLIKHGARYGLCQVYKNEPWHYELRPEAKDQGCPTMYADAAHDPRLTYGPVSSAVNRSDREGT